MPRGLPIAPTVETIALICILIIAFSSPKALAQDMWTNNPARLVATTTIPVPQKKQLANTPLPPISQYQPFVARPPYEINDNGKNLRVWLDNTARSFDLAGALIDSTTNRMRAKSWQVVYPFPTGSRYVNITDIGSVQPSNSGVPGHIEYEGELLKVAYLAGDPTDAGIPPKCRTQLNSYLVPTRTDIAWDLSFQIGGKQPGESWPLLPPGNSPTALWQLKAEPGHPTLAMVVDTDNAKAGTVRLSFYLRTSDKATSDRTTTVSGLEPGTTINVFMTANLDERDLGKGGKGHWHVWVNGQQVSSYEGKTLRSDFTKEAHRWAFGVYLFNENKPASFSRVTLWRQARMLVPK